MKLRSLRVPIGIVSIGVSRSVGRFRGAGFVF
jgi:hypothetical protein